MVALTPCTSAVVKAHGYDASTQTLAVKFNGDKVYLYQQVPPDVAAAFQGAESIGKAYGSMIRGKFEHNIVLDEPTTNEGAAS